MIKSHYIRDKISIRYSRREIRLEERWNFNTRDLQFTVLL